MNTCQSCTRPKKWQTGYENVKPGALFLLKEAALSRNKWLLGRVVEVYLAIDRVF